MAELEPVQHSRWTALHTCTETTPKHYETVMFALSVQVCRIRKWHWTRFWTRKKAAGENSKLFIQSVINIIPVPWYSSPVPYNNSKPRETPRRPLLITSPWRPLYKPLSTPYRVFTSILASLMSLPPIYVINGTVWISVDSKTTCGNQSTKFLCNQFRQKI